MMSNYFSKNPVLLGALLALIQTVFFSFVGLFVRLASEDHHTMDIMFYRNGISVLIFAVILTCMNGGWQKVRQANLKRQMIRGIVGTLAMISSFATFSYLSLSEAQSLFYAGPLFALFLSFPILKEKVGPYRTTAAIIGFIGVLFIAQPANISSMTGGILGIITAIGFAAVMITLRWVGKSEDAIVTSFYFALFGTIIVLPFWPFVWTMPSAETLLYLLLVGAIAVGVQITLTKAYILAPPSVVAPIAYMSLFWSIIMDFVIWGHWPLWGTLVGAGLIIIANIFIVYREAKLNIKKNTYVIN